MSASRLRTPIDFGEISLALFGAVILAAAITLLAIGATITYQFYFTGPCAWKAGTNGYATMYDREQKTVCYNGERVGGSR